MIESPPRHRRSPAVPPPLPPRRPATPSAPVPSRPSRRLSTGVRIALGSFLVVLAAAVTSALFVLGEVHTLRDALNVNPSIGGLKQGSLAPAGYGSPQTLLLVGDDQRALTKYYHHQVLPHANEMLLVRIDPAKPYISMMSIPRELNVPIHTRGGLVTTRFNYAYTAGGIPLLLSTIRQVTGLSVNHVVVTTFARFRRAVDQMGCVYSTVDRRYFHINMPGGEQYQEIDLQPGYQRICGAQALQFVSYRHNDTSLVRDARDQSFLLDVKKQFGPTLADNVHQFERIFGQAVVTDPSLHSTNGILDLLGTLINSSSRRVRQVHFQATLLPTFDSATPAQIAASVHSFLYGGSAVPKHTTAAVARQVHSRRGAAKLPLAPVLADELATVRRMARHVPFAVEYPRVRDRAGAATPTFERAYLIRGPDGTGYPAYVVSVPANGLGQFYDVQGTTWTGAPQFENPEQVIHIGHRDYQLYYEGGKLKLVAWFEGGNVYWVRNTLLDSLENGELLAIAEQTVAISSHKIGHLPPALKLRGAGVPAPTAKVAPTSVRQTVGSIAAVVTLLALPLLAFAVLRRRRELRTFRNRLAG